MSNYETPVLTNKGLEILTRKTSGDGKGTSLKLTKMAIGSGILPLTQKPEELTELVEKVKDINIIDFEIVGLGLSHVTGEVNNIGITQETPIFEVGVYAEDPETLQDVLYTYTYTRNTPTVLFPPKTTMYIGEFSVKTIIRRDMDVEVNIIRPERARNISYDNNKSGLLAKNVQDAIDEVILMHPVNCVINHRLGTYPSATVFEIRYGSGMGGCGETPCGGDEQYAEIKNRMIYMDSNNIRLSLEKQYIGVPMITQINEGVYILMFSDAAVRVSLYMDYVTQNIMMTKKLEALNKGLYNALAELSKSISNNKSNIDSNVSGLNAAITALSTTVVSNKKTTDSSISSLNTSIATLQTTVNNNKTSADNSLKTLSDNMIYNALAITTVNSNLLVKIDNVPIGCGN